MATSPIPSKIGKYDVIGVIGRGGMGVVYQAMDPYLDRKVAIKMITGQFSENSDMLKRFFREAQSLASLQHQNIVTIFDLGDFHGNPYFVMEFMEGDGLDSVLASRRPLNLLEKIAIVIQVCNGLGYAHRRGVTHRDIKPANIMISKDGGIKIFDFGIAHAGQSNVTRTGEVLGTLRYMAPEQVNSKGVDSRTDIFSLGVVLYQLITDHLPFDGENTASTLMKIVSEAPPPLCNFLSAFPPEMEEALLKALAKNPNERYATAEDFALDLSQLQGQLKEELIGQEMDEAASLIEQGEVYKAQGTLLRVLKIDQQHTKASRLLREVQQRIQRDELSKQVRGLRERAEEALADQQFDRALEHVDRALGLDRDNFDLMQLREAIRDAAVVAEKLQKALKAAENAHAEGKLEEAKVAVEAALAVAPNDTQARTLYRLIGRELEERARQQQMDGYLLEARQELSSRKFTAALKILKMAEELDPSAPQVHSLIESAVAGQEQERRRRELEALTHEVEEALNHDDYISACQKADEGLARFPDDRNLLKLKGLADRQRQIEERKQLVERIMAESRVLLQEGRHEELKDKLENALTQLGPEARLQSLLGVVSERLVREQAERLRSERLQQARHSLHDRSFDDAIQILESQSSEMGDDPEVQDLLARARAEQTELVQGALSRAEQETVLDLRVNILEEALRMSPRDGRVKEQLHQARNLNQVITKIVSEAKRLEEERQYDQALAKWETVSAVYQHYPDLKNIIKRIRDMRDHALTSAKQSWINRIEHALSICDYDQAMALLGPAAQAFPWDNDLMALQDQAENGARQRAKAQKLLVEGRKSFANQQWDAGSQLMVRAFQAAPQDPLIRDQAIAELERAARATLERNWQASELMLRRLAEIEPSAANAQDLQATIQERKREESIANAMNAARRLQATGDFQGALREIAPALASYPEDRRLHELQSQLEERLQQVREAARLAEIREKKEAFVQDALRRAQQAVALDGRVQVLEDALRTEPQEARLQQQLNAARDLRTRVQLLVSEARDLEQSRQYDQALAKWEALATAFREYPGLDQILDQARQRNQQSRLEAKSNCIRMLQGVLASADYKRAEDVLAQAKRSFPNDRDLAEIERRIRDGIASRAMAERCLDSASKNVSKEKWRKAQESFQEALAAAKSDPVIREQVLSGLLSAADNALQMDLEASEMLASEAARLEPGSPLMVPVRSRIDAKRRGQFTEQCMATATRCLSSGDWEGALRTLDRGLASYPNEPRLLESKGRVESEIRRREEEQRRARELELHQRQVREQEAREQELRQKEAKQKELREQELRAKQQREQEILQREAREKEAREKEQRIKELREQEQHAREQRAKEHEEERRRVEAQAAEDRALEQARLKSTPIEPTEHEDLSATRIFSFGPKPVATATPLPAATPAPIPPAPPPAAQQALPQAAPTAPVNTLHSERTLAQAEGLTTKVRQVLRDSTMFGKTPSADGHAPEVEPAIVNDELQEAFLPIVERHLAACIGPFAKVLVKRAAAKTTSVLELYTMLAANMDNESDRKAFLAKRSELAGSKSNAAFTKLATPSVGPSVPAPLNAASPSEITPTVVEQVAKRLATHLGPIAPIVARKEAKRASNLREFYSLLAEHIVNLADRERFLKDSGVVKEAPPPGLLTRRNETTSFNARSGNPDAPTGQFKPERKRE